MAAKSARWVLPEGDHAHHRELFTSEIYDLAQSSRRAQLPTRCGRWCGRHNCGAPSAWLLPWRGSRHGDPDTDLGDVS